MRRSQAIPRSPSHSSRYSISSVLPFQPSTRIHQTILYSSSIFLSISNVINLLFVYCFFFLVTDSVSSSFIKCLNRRVSSASADLNVLDSMTFGTVSFEELLGHCNEVYKKNQSDLVLLQDRLQSFGYHIPGNSSSFPVFSLVTEKEICQNWNCLLFGILFKAL